MCTVLLPQGVNPIAVNEYINININIDINININIDININYSPNLAKIVLLIRSYVTPC